MLMYDFIAIGDKLLSYRKRIGLTQAEVAEAANLSNRTYADIERGNVNMRVETLLRICDVLRITPNDILTDTPPTLETQEDEILNQLDVCSPRDKETALRILAAYLSSLR